jgi:hypothetical protein
MLSLHLVRLAGEAEHRVQRVEVAQPAFRHKLSRRPPVPLSDALPPGLAAAVADLVAAARRAGGYADLPRFVLELPFGVLGRARVVAHVNTKGDEVAILRVRYFVGDPQPILGGATDAPAAAIERRDLTDARALIELHTAASDVVERSLALPPASDSADAPEVAELLFYLSLLQSFVRSSIDYCRIKDSYSLEERAPSLPAP